MCREDAMIMGVYNNPKSCKFFNGILSYCSLAQPDSLSGKRGRGKGRERVW